MTEPEAPVGGQVTGGLSTPNTLSISAPWLAKAEPSSHCHARGSGVAAGDEGVVLQALEKLLDAFLSNVLSTGEYTNKKEKI